MHDTDYTVPRMTPREREVLRSLCDGLSNVAPPGVPGKRADLLYVVIFCSLVLRDDYLVLRLA